MLNSHTRSLAHSLYWSAIEAVSGADVDYPRAWQLVQQALRIEPDNPNANVLAGDLWVTYFDEIGVGDYSELEAASRALPFFECALRVESAHADAWAGKSRALRRLRRWDEALEAAEAGLRALPLRVQYLRGERAYRAVYEELQESKALALAGMGRRDEGVQVLRDALSEYPDSWFIKEVLQEVVRG